VELVEAPPAGKKTLTKAVKEKLAEEFKKAVTQEKTNFITLELMPYSQKVSPEQWRKVSGLVEKLFEFAEKNNLNESQRASLKERILELAASMSELKERQAQERAALSGFIEQQKEVFEEALEATNYVEPADGQRTVIASLIPIHSNQDFAQLSLMDYVYFAVAPTGAEGITPTTTYAKFLCSVANIIEVFFLVVFFNSLLSVKGAGRGDHLPG
jgi:hypothetical protein